MKKPQTLSLQEQLLKSGLASDAKAKQIKTEKRKQDKQQRNNGIEITNDIKLDLEQSRLQQVERDRELNQLRKQADERKALVAQIKQLVELNCIAQNADGIVYHFNDDNKVRALYVTQTVREALIKGQAGIVRIDSSYEIVPAEIAGKIRERDAESIVVLNRDALQVVPADDPYADYQIPDDLLW